MMSEDREMPSLGGQFWEGNASYPIGPAGPGLFLPFHPQAQQKSFSSQVIKQK
jgi:hypothetical protein